MSRATSCRSTWSHSMRQRSRYTAIAINLPATAAPITELTDSSARISTPVSPDAPWRIAAGGWLSLGRARRRHPDTSHEASCSYGADGFTPDRERREASIAEPAGAAGVGAVLTSLVTRRAGPEPALLCGTYVAAV